MDPGIAQLVERRTVVVILDFLRSLVRIRLTGSFSMLIVIFFVVVSLLFV